MKREEALELAKQGTFAWNKFRGEEPNVPSLAGSTFVRDKLDRIDFSTCDLANVEFAGCTLRNADFYGSNLEGANFKSCELNGALFNQANLNSAHFHDCDVSRADFSKAEELTIEQFEECRGLDTAHLPEGLYYPDHEDWQEEEEEDEDGEDVDNRGNDTFVKIDGQTTKLPKIPRRVPAPIETAWVDDKLSVVFESSPSSLGRAIIAANIGSLKIEIEDFSKELSGTNVDQRVVERLSRAALAIPESVDEFSEKLFRIWHQFRPVFEYSKIVGAEEGDYLRARFLSLESDLRGLLNSFPEWRHYEFEAQKTRMPEIFDIERIEQTQKEIVSALEKFPAEIDRSVTRSLSEVEFGRHNVSGLYSGPSLYDSSSSFANVLSRLLRRLLDEVGTGGLEGVREGTKKLVVATMIGGGGAMVWLVSNQLGLFPWLSTAWQFVKRILQI